MGRLALCPPWGLQARGLFSVANGARPISQGIPRICLLITDGASNNQASTIATATALKNDNVNIFAIGAGNVNQVELRGVASQPIDDHLFLIGSAGDIPTLVDRMAETTCEAAAQVPACGQIIEEVNAGEFKFFRPLGNGLTENVVLEVIDRSGDGVSVFVSGSDPNPGPYHNDIADDSRSATKLITVSPETIGNSSLYVSVRGNGDEPSQFLLDVYNDLFPNNNAFEIPVEDGLPAGTLVFTPPLPSSPLISGEVLRYRLTAFSRWFEIDSATGQIRTLRALDYDTEADLSVIIAATAAASSEACVQGAILVRILVTPPPSQAPTTAGPTAYGQSFSPTAAPASSAPTLEPETTTGTTTTEFIPTITICSAVDVDDCASGAECIVTQIGAHCVCENGNVSSAASGLCDIPICDTLPCFNGGVCAADRDSAAGFRCGCAAGLVQPQCGPGAPELSFFYYYPQLSDNSIEVPSATGPGTVIAVASATVATGNIRFSLSDAMSERRRRDVVDAFPVNIDPETGEITLLRAVTEATLTMTVNAISRFGALENATTTELQVTIVVLSTEGPSIIIGGDASSANDDDAAASGSWWVIMLVVLMIILCIAIAAFVLWRKNSGDDSPYRKDPGVENPMYGQALPTAPDDGEALYEAPEDTPDGYLSVGMASPEYGDSGAGDTAASDTAAFSNPTYGEADQNQSREGAAVNTAYMPVDPDAGGDPMYDTADSAADAPNAPAIYDSAVGGGGRARSGSVYEGFAVEAPAEMAVYDVGSSYTDVVPTPDAADLQPVYDQGSTPHASEQPTYAMGTSYTDASTSPTPPAGNEGPIYDQGTMGATDTDAPMYDTAAAQDAPLYDTAAVNAGDEAAVNDYATNGAASSAAPLKYDNEDASVDPTEDTPIDPVLYDTAAAAAAPAANLYDIASTDPAEGYLAVGNDADDDGDGDTQGESPPGGLAHQGSVYTGFDDASDMPAVYDTAGSVSTDSWDCMDMPKAEAKARLNGQAPGTFVVRASAQLNFATLSMVEPNFKQFHTHIQRDGQGYKLAKDVVTHDSLEALLTYYSRSDQGVLPCPLTFA